MTIQDIITKVRDLTHDGTGTVRYTDARAAYNAVDAIRHLWRVNGSTRYIGNSLTDTALPTVSPTAQSVDSATLGFTVPVDDRYLLGLAFYAAARCYEGDITDTVNMQLAQALYQKAEIEFL